MKATLAAIATFGLTVRAQYTATYDPNNLPDTTEQQQIGTNKCGTSNNQTGLCQNLYLNSVSDFCLWGPPDPNSVIGATEQIVVSWCTKPGRGTRLIPPGALKSVHFVQTPDYIQITGTGDFTKLNIQAGDAGGELDPHGPDGFGNPHGGLVFSNVWNNGTNDLGEQIHEWTSFMADQQFCIRACKAGPQDAALCQHIYDVMGCQWNIPGDYEDGFDSCMGDDTLPAGLYPQGDGSTSTFFQGQGGEPPAHPAGATSKCSTYTSAAIYGGTTTTTVSTSGTAHPSSSTSSHTNAGTSIRGSLASGVIGLIGAAVGIAML